jgi:membrane associated rhomboid family serine protease
MFNAPWTVVVLCVGLIALYAAQWLMLSDKVVEQLALTRTGLAHGRWQTLFTSMFLHGSWPHVLLNAVAALAFGPPVARLFGPRLRGAVAFFAFYLVCGLLAGLGFAAVDFKDVGAVGASGAISGLVGAAARIIEGHGRVGPIFGRTVAAMTAGWVFANVVLGVNPGWTPGAAGMAVAWQAHLAGYAAGLLLIGPFARLAGRGAEDSAQPPDFAP